MALATLVHTRKRAALPSGSFGDRLKSGLMVFNTITETWNIVWLSNWAIPSTPSGNLLKIQKLEWVIVNGAE
jgi:hypothetical protein